MTPLINKYPLDLTGRSPDNLVTGERHTLVDNSRDEMRVFVPNHGAFYTDTIVVRDISGSKLRPNDDFIATYLYEEATKRSGLEVCAALVVLNPNVPSEVSIDYQTVGGEFATSTAALEQVLQTLEDDDRPVVWGDIIGKPSEYPPGEHLHALWELYGFEYLVVQLERVVQAIVVGDQSIHDEVRAYVRELHQEGKDYTDALDRRFQDHQANSTNPHNVTKAQVGLGLVDNFPTATHLEIEDGSATNRFITVDGLVHGIDFHLGRDFRSHREDYNNPHRVTKTQVGLGRVENFSPSSKGEAETGERNDRYMTPLRTAEAIDHQAGRLLEQHTTDFTNPHKVTKAQVGLGRVANYSVSSYSDAVSGTSNGSYMTPLRVRQALNDHINNNEHDSRYVIKNSNDETSLRVHNGHLQGRVNGRWRTIWPPQWQ